MIIRDASIEDAAEICDVLRRSISELCIADHHKNPARLARWLSNKTAANVAGWIAQETTSFLVAVEGDAVLAVCSVTDAGEILLNYVVPQARFRGISRALLKALEVRAFDRGSVNCTLETTETARRFYKDAGYVPFGDAQTDGRNAMSKSLILDSEQSSARDA